MEKFSINFFSALNNVLKDEIEEKGKLIGKELAKNSPILESKAIKQFKKFHDFFNLMPFKEFIEKLGERTLQEFDTDVVFTATETAAFLTFRATSLLENGAWIFYHILSGIIEENLNEIFNQKLLVTVASINKTECVIKLERMGS